MLDNLALLLAHLLLVLAVMRSVRADKAAQDDKRGSWRDGPRRRDPRLPTLPGR